MKISARPSPWENPGCAPGSYRPAPQLKFIRPFLANSVSHYSRSILKNGVFYEFRNFTTLKNGRKWMKMKKKIPTDINHDLFRTARSDLPFFHQLSERQLALKNVHNIQNLEVGKRSAYISLTDEWRMPALKSTAIFYFDDNCSNCTKTVNFIFKVRCLGVLDDLRKRITPLH